MEKLGAIVKHIQYYFFLYLIFPFSCLSVSITMQPQLQFLLENMKLYKFDMEGEDYIHAGDLYEHSMWVYYAMAHLFETNLVYVQDLHLNQREKEVVCLAALLHDIGKAGRKDFFTKEHHKLFYVVTKGSNGCVKNIKYTQDFDHEHPDVGFKYAAQPLLKKIILDSENYFYINQQGTSEPFDMALLYEQLGLTVKEQQICSILIGMHYEFGSFEMGEITAAQFFNKLQTYVTQVNYNSGIIDEDIVRLSILIQVADVKGIVPVSAHRTPLFPDAKTYLAVYQPLKFDCPFRTFDYESPDGHAVRAMDDLIGYYKRNFST